MIKSLVRVLAVEDNPTDALLLKESLADVSGVQFEITHVQTLAECLEALSTSPFDSVLVDLGLPDSTGLDTFRCLKEAAPAAVILVLTGLEDEDLAIRAVQLGAEDYLMKSQVRTSLLGRIIRYAIERHDLRNELQETHEREAQAREVRSVERLSAPAPTAVTAGIYGGSSIRDGMPTVFSELVGRYAELLNDAIEARTYKVENNLSGRLRDLGDELGLVRASPRDVVELHLTALKEKVGGVTVEKAQAFLEEGRIAVLELMGYVAGYYRSFYTVSTRKVQRT